MQQRYQCPNCGTPVAFEVRFCGNCGTPLNWQQQLQSIQAYQKSTNHQHWQGKPIGMEIWVKNSILYPDEKIRWGLYGKPLSSVFEPYFESVAIEYYQIEGKLHHFIVHALKPSYRINQPNEDEFYNKFFAKLSNDVVNLFLTMNISVQIYDTWRSYQSYDNSLKDSVMKKMGKDPHANTKFNNIEMMKEDMRIIRHADGRYCLAFTDRKSGRRCYTDIPEKVVKEIGEQYVYRIQ